MVIVLLILFLKVHLTNRAFHRNILLLKMVGENDLSYSAFEKYFGYENSEVLLMGKKGILNHLVKMGEISENIKKKYWNYK